MQNTLKDIRVLIRKARINKNYSQENMAFELGITQGAYANLENGNSKISVEKLLQIVQILEIEHRDFMKICEKFFKQLNSAE